MLPDRELPNLLEVVRHLIPAGCDDWATDADMAAHRNALAEYAAGETVSHNDIDWD